MSIYYSPSTNGFFNKHIHQAIPEDAIEITEEQHRELIEGQSKGKSIAVVDGEVVLQEFVRTKEMGLRLCKTTAGQLLAQTDWAMVPDVADNLKNLNDFVAYRQKIRELRVNPVAEPVWPTAPSPEWSFKTKQDLPKKTKE